MENIYDTYSKMVSEQMEQLSYVQAQLVAACSMERLWTLFSEWTKQDAIPYLKVKPKAFRDPVRRLLDIFWEQIWNEQPCGNDKQLLDQIYSFFHEDNLEDDADPQDIDIKDAALMIDAIINYSWNIFFETPSSQDVPAATNDIVYCVTHYLYYFYYDFIYDEFCTKNSIHKQLDKEQEQLLEAYAKQHPTWLEETARIERDINDARHYPSNQKEFMARKEEYSALQLPSVRY